MSDLLNSSQSRTEFCITWKEKKCKPQTWLQMETEKSILLWCVTQCYHITITFMDSFTNSGQGKWNFQNFSSVSMPCFRHGTDISVVHVLSLTLLRHLVPTSFCLTVLVYFFFIKLVLKKAGY